MTDDMLPEPLVAAEIDLRDFQYMELDVRVLRDSRFAAQVSGDAFRAGVLLWCAAWHQVPCGTLPDDDIELANLAGYGRFIKEWRKVRDEALMGFVLCSDRRFYHEVVCAKAAQAWASKLRHHFDRACDRLRKANKAAALKGQIEQPQITFDEWNCRRLSDGIPMERADASAGTVPKSPALNPGIPPENALRGNREGTEQRGRGNGEGDSLFGAEPPAPPPAAPPPAPPPDPAAAAPASRGTRLTPDWKLPKAWGDWALDEYAQWGADKVRLEGEKFRDHWVAKTGKDSTKTDWLATWRNWCRSPIAHQDDPKSPAAKAPGQLSAKNAAAKALLFGPAGSAGAPTSEIIDG